MRVSAGRDKRFLGTRAATLLTLALLATGCGKSAAKSLVPIGAGLDGPAGLKATVYARGVTHASAFAFDARGRLWVTASGDNTHGSDGIYLVKKPGAWAVKVVSGPTGPLGLVWLGPKLVVSSLGRVTAFSNLHGTRFGAQKTILVGPPGGGENNNLVLAPDGRLMMGVSASCDHCEPPTKWSGSIVSFKTDGSDLRLYAGRIRAPFGLSFYPGTSDLLVSMNQRDDLGARTPGDWLAVVLQNQSWGFPGCYGQGGAICARVPRPVAVLGKHAAAGGVAVLASQLGGRYAGSALVSEWKLGKVLRVALSRKGSSYTGAASPFLTGIANPLPVATTPDGALLVGDWSSGTIYQISA